MRRPLQMSRLKTLLPTHFVKTFSKNLTFLNISWASLSGTWSSCNRSRYASQQLLLTKFAHKNLQQGMQTSLSIISWPINHAGLIPWDSNMRQCVSAALWVKFCSEQKDCHTTHLLSSFRQLVLISNASRNPIPKLPPRHFCPCLDCFCNIIQRCHVLRLSLLCNELQKRAQQSDIHKRSFHLYFLTKKNRYICIKGLLPNISSNLTKVYSTRYTQKAYTKREPTRANIHHMSSKRTSSSSFLIFSFLFKKSLASLSILFNVQWHPGFMACRRLQCIS